MFLLKTNNLLRSNNLNSTLIIANRYFSTASPKASKTAKSETLTGVNNKNTTNNNKNTTTSTSTTTSTTTTTTNTTNNHKIVSNNNNNSKILKPVSKSSNRASIYDILRRKRDRAGLVNIEKADSDDVETIVFPRERQGLDYELNWALNSYSITPHHQAYRNTRVQTLLQHTKGTKNSNKVLKVQQPSTSSTSSSVYYLDENNAKQNTGSSVITIPQYKLILDHVKEFISDSQNIYVQDGAIGSDKVSSECLIRCVTNDSFSALFLKHLLPTTSQSNQAAREFKHSMTLYLAPALNTTTDKLAKLGLNSSQFNIIDSKRGIAIISGNHSTENIQSVLNSLYSSVLIKTHPESLNLNADIVFSSKNEKPVLIFNNSKSSDSNIKVVSQGSVWNSQGVSRLYNAMTFNTESSAQNSYDLVETFENSKKVNSIVASKVTQNLYQSPSAVVFMIKDTKGVLPPFSELTADQAEKYFVSGYIGDNQFKPFFNSDQNITSNKSKSEIFKKLIQENNTNVYIINPVSLKDGDVDQLLTSIASGKVNKSTKSDVYSTLSPIGKQGEISKETVKTFESALQSQFDKLLL